MKRISKYLIFILVLFFGMMLNVHAADEITIESITCDNKYNGELRETVTTQINGLTIKIDDSYFYKTGDYFKCTMSIKNNQDEDVMIDSESISSKSDEYVTYELSTTGENLIMKGETKTYILEINYIKEVTDPVTLENEVEIVITNDIIDVPDTSVAFVLVISLLIVLLISVGIVLYTKKSKALIVPIVIALILIPTTYAVLKVSIKIENKIYVEKDPRYKVSYTYDTFLTEEEAEDYYSATNLNECVTIAEQEYCRYEVVVIDGLYKVGDTVEVKDFNRKYVALDCSNCPGTQKNSNNGYSLRKLGNCICDSELKEQLVLDSTGTYWKYDIPEELDSEDLEFDAGGLTTTSCYYDDSLPNNNKNNRSYSIQRLADPSSCHSYYLGIPLSFKMPAHEVALYSFTIEE